MKLKSGKTTKKSIKLTWTKAAGKIKAVGKGSCQIYSYSQNGISKKIKVTIK